MLSAVRCRLDVRALAGRGAPRASSAGECLLGLPSPFAVDWSAVSSAYHTVARTTRPSATMTSRAKAGWVVPQGPCAALATAVAVTAGVVAAAASNHPTRLEDGGDRSQIHSGHADMIRFEGAALLKRLQDEGRGVREADALQLLSASPAWSPFVPRYLGMVTDGEGAPWMSMENLTAGMRAPVVMDLKVGTRHWSPGENLKKRKKELRKATSSGAMQPRRSCLSSSAASCERKRVCDKRGSSHWHFWSTSAIRASSCSWVRRCSSLTMLLWATTRHSASA
mmetsp:Transcript_95203/g.274159  ORF Transcript_95203/g.274159 Transcript_95203/m.274159 type:complete len:281 (-) Transcript_95203:325-1167(-)